MAIDTSGIIPAWMSVNNGVRLPVWFEEDAQESGNANDKEVLWFYLDEVKMVLQMDENLGEKGEWLACGFIPQGRVLVRPESSNADPPKRAFSDEEKEEADRHARRERRRLERERLQLDQQEFEHRIKKTQSSRVLKAPLIPARKSSLNSLADKAITQVKPEATTASKLCVNTHGVSVSLTNADPQRAASLMKYALLMAHGKRVEAEESWLLETAPLAGDRDRTGKVRSMGKERPRHDTGAYLTPPESSRGSSGQRNTHERRGRNGDRDPTSRYELALRDDDQSTQEEQRRTRRSAAPSPSQSMLGYRYEGSNASSLRPRRSRRDLLLELQSDEDSVLREYARVSLQDPTILRRTRDSQVNNDAESEAYHHEDSQSLTNLRKRLATSSTRDNAPALKPPPNRRTHDEADKRGEPPVPSLYSDLTSFSSFSSIPRVSIENASYASVEPASHIKEVEIRSKKSESSGKSASSGDSSAKSATESRLLEAPTPAPAPAQAGARATVHVETEVESFPPFDPTLSEHESSPPPPPPPPPSNPNHLSTLPVFPSPPPTTTPSKSESFFAKGKNLREKGKELSGRLAEVRARQNQKPKAKKDIWELGMWKSGDAKKDGAK
jgi:hypothetical protein